MCSIYFWPVISRPCHTDSPPLSSWYSRNRFLSEIKNTSVWHGRLWSVKQQERIFVAPASASLHLFKSCLSESATGPLRGETPHHCSCHSTGLDGLHANKQHRGTTSRREPSSQLMLPSTFTSLQNYTAELVFRSCFGQNISTIARLLPGNWRFSYVNLGTVLYGPHAAASPGNLGPGL